MIFKILCLLILILAPSHTRADSDQDFAAHISAFNSEQSPTLPSSDDLFPSLCLEKSPADLLQGSTNIIDKQQRLALIMVKLINRFARDPQSLATVFAYLLQEGHFPHPEMLQYYLSIAHFRLGDAKSAVAYADKALKSAKIATALADQLKFLQLENLAKEKKNNELLNKSHWIADLEKNPLFREKIQYMAALAAKDLGRFWVETSYLEKLVVNYPISPEAGYSFDRLVTLSCDKKRPYYFNIPTLRRIAFNAHLEPGISDFLESIKNSKIRKRNGAIGYLSEIEVFEFYFTLRLYDAIISKANELLASENLNTKDQHRLYYYLAKSLLRKHDYKAAASYFSILLTEKSPYVKDSEIKEFLADSLAYDGALGAASKIYGDLSRVNANPLLQWHFIWSQYLSGTYQNIDQYMSDRKISFFPLRDPTYEEGRKYWFAKVLLHNGKEEKAQKIFKEVLNEAPDNIYAYYIAQSHPELLGQETLQSLLNMDEKSPKKNPPILDAVNQNPLDYVYKAWNTPETIFAGLQLDETLYNSQTGEEKLEYDLGFSKRDSHPTTNSYVLSASARDTINNKLPRQQNWHALIRHQSNEPELWHQYYPLAYFKQVKFFAEKLEIDPYIILSIMRSESEYLPFAESHMGALGLMQIMPFTGLNIARRLNFSSFMITDLLNPNINIPFAAWYIKELLGHYQMHPTLAVAAYNAGPAFVDTWLTRCKKCTAQEFIETIPFKETRQYVKKTLRHYLRYKRIYGQIELEDLAFLRPLPRALESLNQLF